MSDQSVISRRDALIAAVSVGAAVAVADASEKDPSGSSKQGDAQFKLSITLTDGQIVTFKAREAVIDFGTSGQLLVRPTGVMPMVEKGLDPRGDKNGFNRTETPFDNQRER